MATRKDATSNNSTFMRIPGLCDEHGASQLTIDGLSCSIADCIELLHDETPAVRARALRILAEVSSPTRSEVNLITQAIHTALTAAATPATATHAEHALCAFLSLHRHLPEALSLAAQWINTWSGTAHRTPSKEQFLGDIRAAIVGLRPSDDTVSPNRITEVRYVLCRAFEAPLLRDAAADVLHSMLRDEVLLMANDRRTLAEHVLSVFRKTVAIEERYRPLRRIASALYTGGGTRSLSQAPPPRVQNEPSSMNREQTALSPAARKIVESLLADTSGEVVSRLVAHDYEIIRGVHGLSLEDFRVLTARLRPRASIDPWARSALLSIVRAPHSASVSCSVRTAVLGSLVNEARRMGGLSSQIEKEVLSISAEIPSLVSISEEDDGETTRLKS